MPDYAERTPEHAQSADASVLAGLDAGQQSALGQSAELTGGNGGGNDAAAAQAREAERVAAAQADWEKVLGEKLGGKLFELIRKSVNYSELTGYAHEGSQALADALADGPLKATEAGAMGGLMDEAAEAEALNKLIAAFAPSIQAAVDKWIDSESGQKVFKGISDWVEEHPRTVLGLAGAAIVGAAVGAYLSNMNPDEFEKTFKLSEKWSVGGAIDLPGLQQIMNQGVESAKVFVEYKGKELQAGISGTYNHEGGHEVNANMKYTSGPWSAQAKARHHTEEGTSASGSVAYSNNGLTASLEGSHDDANGLSTTARAGYETDGFTAGAHVTHNQEGTSGGANVSGEGRVGRFDGNYNGTLEINPDGRATLNLDGGLSGMIADTEVEAGLGLSHAQGGENDPTTRLEASLMMGDKGDNQRVTGWMDPNTDAFGLTFDRTALDGAFTQSSGMQADADGNISSSTDLKYNAEDFTLGAGAKDNADGTNSNYLNLSLPNYRNSGVDLSGGVQGTNGELSGYNLGMGFDLNKVRTELALEMKDGVTTGSASLSGQSGEWSYGANTTANLTQGRIDELGLKLGWKDTDRWRSFVTNYKMQWMEENAEYAHNFDATFEYAIDKVSMRLKGGAQLQGSGVTGANADLLAGYKLNPNWAIIGGGDYRMSDVDGTRRDQFGVRAGVQYKDIAVTVGAERFSDSDDTQFGIRLEIPLGW